MTSRLHVRPRDAGVPGAPAEPTGDAAAAGDAQAGMVRGFRWLTASTLVLSLLNYVYSLGLTHLLDVGAFAVFAAGQALLLTAGTVSGAAVPWVLAQQLAITDDLVERRRAVWFAVTLNAALGAVAAGVLYVLGRGFADPLTSAVVAGATFLVFVSSSTTGVLQGARRFGLLGLLKVGDSALKIVAGLALVAVGTGAAGALGGFAAGSLLLVVAGAWVARRELRPVRGSLRAPHLWRSTAGVGGIQALVSVLVTLDVVLVAVLLPVGDAATYQASMILSRVPLFLAAAVAVAAFPVLASAEAGTVDVVRRSVRAYLLMVVPYTVALATVPPELLRLVFPPEYDGMPQVLPLTAVAGAAIGTVSLLATVFQARRRYVPSLLAQGAGLAVQAVALLVGAAVGGVVGLAVGGVVGTCASVVALLVAAPAHWRRAVVPPVAVLVLGGATAAVSLALAGSPVAWVVVIGAVGAGAAVVALRGRPGDDGPAAAPRPDVAGQAPDRPRRLRIVHLGFEDWRKPGSGGGAVRTREVNERLARRGHDVTVLVSRYRGARARTENGVRWVPVGLPLGYFAGMVSYLLLVPFVARRMDADLLVEDFAAPIGSVLPATWTRLPSVAVVQWLNAEEKAAQYHLPFDRVQALGVRRHSRFVAMSEDLGARIREGNPDARVDVVPNGVPQEAFAASAPRGQDVVFLGRLEIAQKGVDLLLDAWADVAPHVPGRLVLVGDGPDRREIERRARRLGLTDRVELVGRLDGAAKLEALAGARVVAMPSRFETFGMVAAEALACGTPVVAFRIPCLREVVEPGTGVLVPPFDAAAFARALVEVLQDPAAAEEMGSRGRALARRYDWDAVAAQQEQVYLAAVGSAAAAPPRS